MLPSRKARGKCFHLKASSECPRPSTPSYVRWKTETMRATSTAQPVCTAAARGTVSIHALARLAPNWMLTVAQWQVLQTFSSHIPQEANQVVLRPNFLGYLLSSYLQQRASGFTHSGGGFIKSRRQVPCLTHLLSCCNTLSVYFSADQSSP